MNTVKKIIVLTIIFGSVGNFIFLLKPTEVYALVPVIDPANLAANTTAASAILANKILYFTIEFIVKPLVRQIANSLENKLVNKVNTLISNIDAKTPSYITNWRNYILESEARGNDVFRGILADSNLCPYLKDKLIVGFGAQDSIGVTLGAKVRKKVSGGGAGSVLYENKLSVPGEPSFRDLSRCTLPDDFDINRFKQDFNAGGGWEAWNKLIQPQNNFLGAYTMALAEREKQKSTEEKAARDSSLAGSGFRGQKLSANNSASPTGCTGVSLPGKLPSNDALLIGRTSAGVRCAFLGKEVTPAKILGESAANTLDAKIGRVGAAAYLTDVVLNVVDAVITGLSDRLTNFSGQKAYDQAGDPETFSESNIPAVDPDLDNEIDQIQRAERAEQADSAGCRGQCIDDRSASCDQTDPSTGLPDQDAQEQCLNRVEADCIVECSSI